MRKTLVAAALLTGVSSAAMAEGWQFPALTSEGYTAEPTIALIGGALDPDVDGADSGSLRGVELSLNCPLIQPPSNRIRQQISLTRYDEDNLEITALELNPHYVVPVGSNVELGFGPGLAVLNVDNGTKDETLYGLNVGASMHYRRGAFFFGAEARYQLTTEEDFGAGDTDVNNTRVLLKVGMDI